MLPYYLYNEFNHTLLIGHVKNDQRDFEIDCANNIHGFPPQSKECVCGKYKELPELVVEK